MTGDKIGTDSNLMRGCPRIHIINIYYFEAVSCTKIEYSRSNDTVLIQSFSIGCFQESVLMRS